MELIPRAASRLASPQWQFRDTWWFGGASTLKHDAIHIYIYIYMHIMEIYLDRLIMFSDIPGRLFDISGCFFMGDCPEANNKGTCQTRIDRSWCAPE